MRVPSAIAMTTWADRLGPRRNTSAWDAASWMLAVAVLTLAIPASEKIAGNELFFTAHGVAILGWIIVLSVTLLLAWLVVGGLLTSVSRWSTPKAVDVVSSLLIFAVSAFGIGNMLALTYLSDSQVLAFLSGVVLGAVVTLVSRRLAMGRVLFAFASAAVFLPLALALMSGGEEQLGGAAFADDAPRPDVVWVIADELQYPLVVDGQGRVRPEFPNLRGLQDDATTYTQAYATANYTDYAVPAQFNGVTDVGALGESGTERMKSSKGLIPGLASKYRIIMDSPLFKYVCDSGDCATVSPDPNADLVERYALFMEDAAAIAGQTALAEPFSGLFPSLAGKWRDYWDPGAASSASLDAAPVSRVIASMEQAKASQSYVPTFTFWHTLRTHAPWPLDRDGKTIYPPTLPVVEGGHLVGSDAEGRFSTPELVSIERRLYANSAVDFDRQLGLLLDHLRSAGTYDSTLIIVTADHGAAITRTADRRIGDTAVQRWSEVGHVPLLVKAPGQREPLAVVEPRSTGQIAATVMATVGATTPAGLSLAADLSASPEGGLAFTNVAGGALTSWKYTAVEEVDPWTADDLTPPDPRHPFAVGIDPRLIDAPVPSGWTEIRDGTIDPLPGESDQVVLVVEADTDDCGSISTPGLVSSAGVVTGSLLWQADGKRAWAIVPRSTTADYHLWCPA